MIYCRWGGNSSVYVYQNVDGRLYCRACTLYTRAIHSGSESYKSEGRTQMLKHLLAHRKAGDKVPDEVFKILEKEINEANETMAKNYNSIIIGFPYSRNLPIEGKQKCARCDADVAINPSNIPRIKEDKLTILCIPCGTTLYQELEKKDKITFGGSMEGDGKAVYNEFSGKFLTKVLNAE